MLESIRDLNLSNTSEIPNSYLYQPESDWRNWMIKRGKDQLAYYDLGQVQKMKDYFKQLDVDRSGLVGPSEIEETLITLGLAKTETDVDAIVSELDRDRNGELDFNEFLELLKDTSMKNNKTNFLNGRNLLYQKPVEKTVLPKLIGVNAGEEFKEY